MYFADRSFCAVATAAAVASSVVGLVSAEVEKRQSGVNAPASTEPSASYNQTIVLPILVIVLGIGIPCLLICLYKCINIKRNPLKKRTDALLDYQYSLESNPNYNESYYYPKYDNGYYYYDPYYYYDEELQNSPKPNSSVPVVVAGAPGAPAQPQPRVSSSPATTVNSVNSTAAKTAAEKKTDEDKDDGEYYYEEGYEYEEEAYDVEEEAEEEEEAESAQETQTLKIIIPGQEMYKTFNVPVTKTFGNIEKEFLEKLPKKPKAKQSGKYTLFFTRKDGKEVALDSKKSPSDYDMPRAMATLSYK